MESCNFCKKDCKDQLKSCVCRKVSYCSKECQAKDWKVHKPSCPPFIIRESPGMGRGLFATRKIKEGQLILEEYPLLTLRKGTSVFEFQVIHYPYIDEETKEMILKLRDPEENLDIPDMMPLEEDYSDDSDDSEDIDESDKMMKILRIFNGNNIQICGEEDLYRQHTDLGLYSHVSLINHACVSNSVRSWVMGDFERKQVRAIKTIEKDEEILTSYLFPKEFVYGSREFRQQKLLEFVGFLCQCSVCSLEGEALLEDDRIRAKIRQKTAEINQLLSCEESAVEEAMKVAQRKTKLVQKLDIRSEFFSEMIQFCGFAVLARKKGISAPDPEIFRQEALKYAKMSGDCYIYSCNTHINSFGI